MNTIIWMMVVLYCLLLEVSGDNLFHLFSLSVPCNDGTPAGYYFRTGSGSGKDVWVIRLQGGGWCWDIPSCKDRLQQAPYWMTSKFLPNVVNDTQNIAGVPHGGILSSDPSVNPYFHNANHVYLWYCSSDSHLGNRTASVDTGNWHFRGKDIVKEMVNHLLNVQNPSIKSAKKVLVTGDSAGGVGALNNADYIAQLLGNLVDSIEYKAFIDAGWFLDVPPFNNNAFSFRMCAQQLLANWKVIYDQDCTTYYKGQEWKCFHTQYARPFIQTELFFHEFQWDAANLGYNGIPNPPYNTAQSNYVQNFRDSMNSLTLTTPYFFSPACIKHEIEDTNLFSSLIVNGVRNVDAIGKWFLGTSSNVTRWVDTCQPLNCNPTC